MVLKTISPGCGYGHLCAIFYLFICATIKMFKSVTFVFLQSVLFECFAKCLKGKPKTLTYYEGSQSLLCRLLVQARNITRLQKSQTGSYEKYCP